MKVLQLCLLLIDTGASLKILDNIITSSARKNMIPIPLLVFHLVQAFGTLKGLFNLITKSKTCVFSISRNFYTPVNFDKAI